MTITKSRTDRNSLKMRFFKVVYVFDDEPAYHFVDNCTSEGGIREILSCGCDGVESITELTERQYCKAMDFTADELSSLYALVGA